MYVRTRWATGAVTLVQAAPTAALWGAHCAAHGVARHQGARAGGWLDGGTLAAVQVQCTREASGGRARL